jgi:hypothetical protein
MGSAGGAGGTQRGARGCCRPGRAVCRTLLSAMSRRAGVGRASVCTYRVGTAHLALFTLFGVGIGFSKRSKECAHLHAGPSRVVQVMISLPTARLTKLSPHAPSCRQALNEPSRARSAAAAVIHSIPLTKYQALRPSPQLVAEPVRRRPRAAQRFECSVRRECEESRELSSASGRQSEWSWSSRMPKSCVRRHA